ncbi:MAG: hypothetical protein COA58_04435 [Bacteroidetes bacterium]|nr:MAG: hypothetical protein COA58_04435 [Bacteroidota bacterium]
MIQLLTKKFAPALILSLVILLTYWVILDSTSTYLLVKFIILLTEGLLLNYFCFRFGIIGLKTNIPLVLFSILSVLIAPDLSYSDLIYGAVWLAAFFLTFEGRDHPEKAVNYMIYFGVLLGIAQTINNISILLIIPVFILFIQTGTRSVRGLLLSLMYFFMVVIAYIGVLYVMEIPHKIGNLVPSLSLDYSVFDTILIKLFLPYVGILTLSHFLLLNNYAFRYPNKSKILNFTMLIQLGIAALLILITAQLNVLIYAVMALSVILSFVFTYKGSNVFINAAFASLFCIAGGALYLYTILIL